jgi:two-component system, cell cycle response regulator
MAQPRQDHICSGRTCMFCRVLDQGGNRRPTGARAFMDNQVIERVKELEQRSLLTNTQSRMGAVKGEEIERLALLDTLTELYNSRTFLKEIKDELKRAKRYKRPVAVCMLSIDNFREIHRNYGALTSDAVLKAVGGVLQSSIRDVDIPARYSGEEFAVIFPETNAAGAAIVTERIRQRIASQAVSHNWHNLRITTSIGLAAFPAHAREHDELVNKSIQALEMAMQRGGDRVCSV